MIAAAAAGLRYCRFAGCALQLLYTSAELFKAHLLIVSITPVEL